MLVVENSSLIAKSNDNEKYERIMRGKKYTTCWIKEGYIDETSWIYNTCKSEGIIELHNKSSISKGSEVKNSIIENSEIKDSIIENSEIIYGKINNCEIKEGVKIYDSEIHNERIIGDIKIINQGDINKFKQGYKQEIKLLESQKEIIKEMIAYNFHILPIDKYYYMSVKINQMDNMVLTSISSSTPVKINIDNQNEIPIILKIHEDDLLKITYQHIWIRNWILL